VSQWCAAGPCGFFRGRGDGGSVPRAEAARWVAGLGAWGNPASAVWRAALCPHPYGLVAHGAGYLECAAHAGADFGAFVRSRLAGGVAGDARAANDGDLVLCGLY